MGCAGTASHNFSLENQGISGSQGRMYVCVLFPETPDKSTFKVGHQHKANVPLLHTKYRAGDKLPCPVFQGGQLWYANWMPEQHNMCPLTWPTFLITYYGEHLWLHLH